MGGRRKGPIEPIVCGFFSGMSMDFLKYQIEEWFFSGEFSCPVPLVIVPFFSLVGAGPEGVACGADSLCL